MKRNILFDVDSTLVTFEGLDFLAGMKGKEEELAKLTVLAMNGSLAMRDAMEIKMNSLQPSFYDLVKMGEEYTKHLVTGARETIKELQKAGHRVWILTGNFQPAVGILASYLGIPLSQVITNEIKFNHDGSYHSFNLEHPLSNNHGKAKMIKKHSRRLKNVVMVGDGSTDLDTKPCVDLFIGFGGVVKRPNIAKESQVYIEKPDLREILQFI